MKRLAIVFLVLSSCVNPYYTHQGRGYQPFSNEPDEVFYHRHDPFQGVSFFRHRNFIQERNFPLIEVYLVRNESTGLMNSRARITYTGHDWIFMKRAILIGGGERLVLSYEWDVTTNVRSSGNTVWVEERADILLSDTQAQELMNMMHSGPAIQLVGEKRAEYVIPAGHAGANWRMLDEFLRQRVSK